MKNESPFVGFTIAMLGLALVISLSTISSKLQGIEDAIRDQSVLEADAR